MDNLTKEQRYRNMKAIKAKDTTIEMILRRSMYAKGIRYRVHRNLLGTHPDIIIAKYKIAIFCDGDFWHGKSFYIHPPSTNRKYWYEKIQRNKERDLEQTILLRDSGWCVLRFWESEIRADVEKCTNEIIKAIRQKKKL